MGDTGGLFGVHDASRGHTLRSAHRPVAFPVVFCLTYYSCASGPAPRAVLQLACAVPLAPSQPGLDWAGTRAPAALRLGLKDLAPSSVAGRSPWVLRIAAGTSGRCLLPTPCAARHEVLEQAPRSPAPGRGGEPPGLRPDHQETGRSTITAKSAPRPTTDIRRGVVAVPPKAPDGTASRRLRRDRCRSRAISARRVSLAARVNASQDALDPAANQPGAPRGRANLGCQRGERALGTRAARFGYAARGRGCSPGRSLSFRSRICTCWAVSRGPRSA